MFRREPGDVFYHLEGQLIPESTVVDEFRDFVEVMRVDFRRLSNEPTALNHTDADVTLDQHESLRSISTAQTAPSAPLDRSRMRRFAPPISPSTASSPSNRAA